MPKGKRDRRRLDERDSTSPFGNRDFVAVVVFVIVLGILLESGFITPRQALLFALPLTAIYGYIFGSVQTVIREDDGIRY